jgi:branched-chain amino acid transport system ATP-binding protein
MRWSPGWRGDGGPAMRLEVKDVAKRYGGLAALDGVDLSLAGPGIVGLIGPNGAGKTTLFDVMTGRIRPDRGAVLIDGTDLSGCPPHALTRLGVARTFQECRTLPEETCADNIVFALQDKRMGGVLRRMVGFDRAARRAHREEALRLLDLVTLSRYADSPASALSFGQKRLLEIACALATRPRLMLFDEPASGVNPTLLRTLEAFVLRQFEERRTLFVIVEHNMEFILRLSRWVVVMHQGRVLAQGTPDEIRRHPQVIDAYLG